MDAKKAVITASIVAVLLGVAVFVVVLIRARGLAEEPLPPDGQTSTSTTTPPTGGGLTSGGGSSTQAPSADEPGVRTPEDDAARPAVTTVDPDAEVVAVEGETGCDIADDAIDCDYDYLTNAEERKYKTDPLKEDTDGDGLLDSSEVVTWKTDPLNPRSVDPAMTDLEAVNAGKRDTR